MVATTSPGWVPEIAEYLTPSPPGAVAPVPAAASPLPRPPAGPPAARGEPLVVVVVAAGGGVGRSTVAELLAWGLHGLGRLLLVDGAPGMFSPRRGLPRGEGGLAAVRVEGGRYWVLAPEAPLAQYDALTAVDSSGTEWSTFVVDTYDPVLRLVHDDRWRQALTRPWVRVVLATASAAGPLGQAVAAAGMLRQAGVPAGALTGAVVDVSAGRVPGPALAKITLLGGDCGAVVRVPHLPPVRAVGRIEGDRTKKKAARRVAALLAQHVTVEEAV